MKILVISQNYYPEQFRINDITQELVNLGHSVTVLTGIPNYPKGEVFSGYEKGQKRNEIINGVNTIRVYERPRKNGGAINLFLNYYSFVWSSLKYFKKLDKDFDVVFVNQLSPIMQSKVGIKYKKKYGSKLVLYCLDLWPASLVAGGVKQGTIIYNFYKKVSRNIYKEADKILISSKMFIDYFKSELQLPTDNITYLPQYAEDLFNVSELDSGDDKTKSLEKINLVFAGNIGKMQSVETIINCANIMKEYPICFHIVGDGSNLQQCKKIVSNDAKVIFYGQCPLLDMPKFYNLADAMLVSLKKDKFISLTLPGKVQSYMAFGKPIIACGESELKRVIDESGCGICVDPEQPEELKKGILLFVENMNKKDFGQNAKKYYNENFSKENFYKILLNTLKGESNGNI